MNVSVLYEDDDLLVIDKPVGLVVHPARPAGGPDGKTKERTLTQWIAKQYPEITHVGEPLKLSGGEQIERPGIVHRLDRETSGVLIIARTQKTFEYLKEQFQNRKIIKTYNAFIYGVPARLVGSIDRPIGRSAKDFRLRSAERGARGELRDAMTEYRVLRHTDKVSYVEAKPKTGRTHQIRVHFKSIHHPVVCDTLYAPKQPCILSFKRLALHALSLEFITQNGTQLIVEAPLPSDFKEALSLLEGVQ